MSIRNNDKGVALVLAIIIAIILLSMGYLVYSLTSIGLSLERQDRQNLQDRIALHQQFVSALSGSTLTYNSNIPPSGATAVPNNHTSGDENARFDSFMIPEPGTSMRTIDYYMSVGSNQLRKIVQIKVPSNRQPSADTGINKVSIALNIPAINFDSLQSQQFNLGSRTLTDGRVGYIGDVTIDSNSEELTLSRPGLADVTLDISNELTDGGTYALSQGWRLNDGNWEVSLGIYDASNSESGCVITTSLNDFIANFNTQSCIVLNNTEIDIRPDQEFLNCFGALPNLDDFPTCIKGTIYDPNDNDPDNDICHEEGILFIAQYYTNKTPMKDSGAWRPFYPDPEWVQPYHPDVQYAVGNKIIYDSRRYIMDYWVNPGKTPYNKNQGAGWKIDDVYPWHKNITYRANDIVIRNYQFYRAKWQHRKKDPLTAGQWGEWAGLGYVNDGLTALDYLNTCDNTVTPTQQYLNCYGAYPAIGGNTACSSSGSYTRGDQCVYNGLLMENVSNRTTGWPGSDANLWRVVYPNTNWVMPYNNSVRYNVGDRIVFQNKRFILSSTNIAGNSPYDTDRWNIDGIYEWDSGVDSYHDGDVVIHNNGIFYEARRDTDKEPKRNPFAFDDWRRIGNRFNGQRASFFTGQCDGVVAQV